MPSLSPRLPERGRFGKLYAKINELQNAIEALTPRPGFNTRVHSTNAGFSVETIFGTAEGTRIRRFFLREVEDDYLRCTASDEEDDDSNIYVAKPWKLQRTPWDGLVFSVDGVQLQFTYTSATARTVSDGSNSENQVVTEPWLEGVDWIHAIRADTDVEGPSGLIRLQDINVSAHAWARVSSS